MLFSGVILNKKNNVEDMYGKTIVQLLSAAIRTVSIYFPNGEN